MTSITPPSESPSRAASLMTLTISAEASGSMQRTSSASTASRSSGPGRNPAVARAEPIWITWDTIRTPNSPRSFLARAPAATRAAVSLAEARSSTSRASVNPYFCMPARSAWPGRTWVSGARVGPSSALGDISVCHFSGLRFHSELPIWIATGEPSVRPWRTPPMRVISSRSNRMRGPRP